MAQHKIQRDEMRQKLEELRQSRKPPNENILTLHIVEARDLKNFNIPVAYAQLIEG